MWDNQVSQMTREVRQQRSTVVRCPAKENAGLGLWGIFRKKGKGRPFSPLAKTLHVTDLFSSFTVGRVSSGYSHNELRNANYAFCKGKGVLSDSCFLDV